MNVVGRDSPSQSGNCSRYNHDKSVMMEKPSFSIHWGGVMLADKDPIGKLKGSKFLALILPTHMSHPMSQQHPSSSKFSYFTVRIL